MTETTKKVKDYVNSVVPMYSKDEHLRIANIWEKHKNDIQFLLEVKVSDYVSQMIVSPPEELPTLQAKIHSLKDLLSYFNNISENIRNQNK